MQSDIIFCRLPLFTCVYTMMRFLSPQEEWPEDEEVRRLITADFDPNDAIGDRRQELVFIGQVRRSVAVRIMVIKSLLLYCLYCIVSAAFLLLHGSLRPDKSPGSANATRVTE